MDKATENIVRSKKKRESSTPTIGRNFETKYLYRKKETCYLHFKLFREKVTVFDRKPSFSFSIVV